jgi:YHS domain-containing protein
MTLLRLSAFLRSVLVFPLLLAACGEPSVADARAEAGTVNGLCPVREEPVVNGSYIDFDGQRIGFCCPPCSGDFRKDPETYLNKMRANREKFGYVGS